MVSHVGGLRPRIQRLQAGTFKSRHTNTSECATSICRGCPRLTFLSSFLSFAAAREPSSNCGRPISVSEAGNDSRKAETLSATIRYSPDEGRHHRLATFRACKARLKAGDIGKFVIFT